MQVKTFIDESLPKALYKAKQEYGGDIILLESQEIRDEEKYPGKTMVKITISVQNSDEKEDAWQQAQEMLSQGTTELKKESLPKEGARINNIDQSQTAKKPNGEKEQKILEELALLRREIARLSLKADEQENSMLPPVFKNMYQHLKEKGVSEEIARNWIRRIYKMFDNPQKAAEREIRDNLKSTMRQIVKPYTFSQNGLHQEQQIILLIGSTGVGKTTTAMKLAAHPNMFAQKEVGILSLDPYGPPEALRSFGNISGVEVVGAKGKNEIAGSLKQLSDKEVIIVDTPGRSPFENNHLKILEEYIKIIKPTDIFLVLAMNTDLDDLFLSCAVYLMLKPTGVAFTKIDETTKPGKLFSILHKLKLPVVYFSEGRRVFIDIAPGEADYIERKIFDREEKQ